jgi:cathepsin C
MIYDEGFDFNFNKGTKDYRSYFAFLKYGPNDNKNPSIKSKWVSYCHTTLVGWYHIGDQWGCFMGTMVGKSDTEITNGEAEKKQVVTEGSMVAKAFLEKSENIINGNEISESRFMESKFTTKLELTANFKDHSSVVERINAMDYSWKAANYEEFQGLTIEELNKIAGRKKSKSSYTNYNFHEMAHRRETSQTNKSGKKPSNNMKGSTATSTIPENFNWMDLMANPKSQGACGSCFAVSTITMIEARLRKNYPELVKKYFKDPKNLSISVDHVLKCSIYNQGCDGGYSFLVGKFFNEYDMLPTQCFKAGGKCDWKCEGDLAKLKMSVSDFYYAGGSYGNTNEQNLMEEVYKNGPMAVSLEPEYSFMHYRSGIYDVNSKNWYSLNLSKPQWQKVDHSVVLVGWGVENVNGKDVKYWLLQNSWGAHWGEKGYMKFRRGVDLSGIESIGEVAIPTMKEI